MTLYNMITQLLVCSYATGWAMVSVHAKVKQRIDLCQFVRAFILSPFVFAPGAFITLILGELGWIIISHIGTVLLWSAGAGVVTLILALLGIFVAAPIVKKAHGVAKPFTDKICIVLYRKKP